MLGKQCMSEQSWPRQPVDSVLDVVILFRLIVIITLGACLTQGCMTAAAMYVLNRTSTS